MKTKKSSLSLITILLLAATVFAQKSPQKTLVTTLNPQDAEKIVLDLEDRLEIQKWDKDYVGIYIELNTNINHRNVIEQLVKNGRYEIESFLNEKNDLTITAPNLMKIVTVNKTPLEEDIKFRLFIPSCQDFAVAPRSNQDELAVSHIDPKH
jgi:hypothetical protein